MTEKKKVTNLQDNIRKRMGEPPKQSFLNDMLDSAPLKSSMLRLNLDHIQRYERNPRWTPNPDYEDIKASIRERGLDQPLIVTLRPGDRHHTLKKGGGTRYQILRELWEETEDKRYYDLEVVVEPYKDELDLFIGHGIENLKRGQMSFIESAKFYVDLKQIHEDIEGRELSTREACEHINKDGFSIDHSILIKYTYALHLYQFIPKTLEAGAGRPVIEKIRRHEKVSREIWEQHSGDPEQFDELWGQMLNKHDKGNPEVPYDLGAVQAEFETAAGHILDVLPQHFSGMVDLALRQPDRTAMSALSSGPSRPPAPTVRAAGMAPAPRPPAPQPEFADDLKTSDPENNDSVEPVKPPTRTSVGSHRHTPPPQAGQPSPQPAAAMHTASANAPNRISLLPPHIQKAPGPKGGYEHIRSQVEQDLATLPGNQDAVLQAANPVIAWANALFGYFKVPSIPEEGDLPGQLIFVSVSARQIHLRAPDRYLTGEDVFDHVWLRIAQIFYAPALLEHDEFSIQELTAMFHTCCKSFANTEEGPVEQPDLQLTRVIYLHTLSHLIFADPAHHWLDQCLLTLEANARNYHLVRRQQDSPIINPLGPITPPSHS